MSRAGTFDVLVWAEGQKCGGPGPKAVLLALARISGLKEDGTWSCWPGVKLLAEITEQSDRTVRSQLADMEAKGLISRTRRTRSMGEGRGRTTDRITLAFQQAISAAWSSDQSAEPSRPSGKIEPTQRQPVAAQNYQGTTKELRDRSPRLVDKFKALGPLTDGHGDPIDFADDAPVESFSVPIPVAELRSKIRKTPDEAAS